MTSLQSSFVAFHIPGRFTTLLPAVSAAVHPYHQCDNLFLVCYAVGYVLALEFTVFINL